MQPLQRDVGVLTNDDYTPTMLLLLRHYARQSIQFVFWLRVCVELYDNEVEGKMWGIRTEATHDK